MAQGRRSDVGGGMISVGGAVLASYVGLKSNVPLWRDRVFIAALALVIVGFLVILWGRRKPASDQGHVTQDSLERIIAKVLEDRSVPLRDELSRQGIEPNQVTVNIYLTALQQDSRVEIKGPRDDPEVVPKRLYEEGRAEDELVVEKEDVEAPTALVQPAHPKLPKNMRLTRMKMRRKFSQALGSFLPEQQTDGRGIANMAIT